MGITYILPVSEGRYYTNIQPRWQTKPNITRTYSVDLSHNTCTIRYCTVPKNVFSHTALHNVFTVHYRILPNHVSYEEPLLSRPLRLCRSCSWRVGRRCPYTEGPLPPCWTDPPSPDSLSESTQPPGWRGSGGPSSQRQPIYLQIRSSTKWLIRSRDNLLYISLALYIWYRLFTPYFFFEITILMFWFWCRTLRVLRFG